MKSKSFMDFYLSGGVWLRRLIDIGEWIIIVGIGIFFSNPKILSWIGFKILGGITIIAGIFLHILAHSAHKEAHLPKEKIKKIVTTGIYSKIRHPCYTSYFLLYFGVFLIFGSLSMLFPIFLFSYIFYDSSKKEEEYLKEKFGKEYENYMKNVPWRFIPKIF